MNIKLALALLAFSCLLGLPLFAANIVVNPGFETGDLSGWTTRPDQYGWFNDHQYNPGAYDATTGCRGASCLTLGGPGESYLYQDLATIPGTAYYLRFWYGGGPNVLDVYWEGIQQYHHVMSSGPPQHFQVFIPGLLATGASTRLQFDGDGIDSFVHLNRVEVDTPEPGTVGLLSGVLIAFALRLRHRSW